MVGLKRTASGLAVLFGAALAGCAGPTQTSGELLDRFDSAQQIRSTDGRQAALAQIARDAANSGEADISLRAVDGIERPVLRDQTAAACADILNARGQRDKADLMVDKIGDVAVQDRIHEDYAAHPAPMRRF
jgi:hypothetical protein